MYPTLIYRVSEPYSLLPLLVKPHEWYGGDYAATAKSAPTNAIASSKVKVDFSPIKISTIDLRDR